MVSQRQEQPSIMNFTVPFLKMLTLYMLWRARFLSELYAFFCVYQILILLPLKANENKPNILTSKLYKVTKSVISPQRKLGSFRNLKLRFIRH